MKTITIYADKYSDPVRRFVKALEMTGMRGIPVLFPEGRSPEECAEKTDGLILIGGADIDPMLYLEENTESRGVDRAYDEAELLILDTFLKAKKPVLCVCRGFQLANVYFGGTLLQDIPGHQREESDPHTVTIPGGIVLPVNSTHHQAVCVLGSGLEPFAVSPDGIIEGFRSQDGLLLGVQWHPERLIPGEDKSGFTGAEEHPAGLPVFREFAYMLISRYEKAEA